MTNGELQEILIEELESIGKLLIMFVGSKENQIGIDKYEELLSAMSAGCDDLNYFIQLLREKK
jgi:hypothetical protein